MAVSESNSDTILSGMFEHALGAYLQKGESRDAMLKKFNGDKIELIKFLRDRDYNEWIKTNKKPADTSDIKNKIHDLKKQHEKDVADGSLRLYDTPRVKEKVDAPAIPAPKSAPAKPAEPEAPKVEVKKEEKPIVKYVEPPVLKKKWSKKKEKPKPDKDQQSFF